VHPEIKTFICQKNTQKGGIVSKFHKISKVLNRVFNIFLRYSLGRTTLRIIALKI